MIKYLLGSWLAISLFACSSANTSSVDHAEAQSAMLDADRAFSRMSEEKGMRAAYLEFIDSAGVLLRPNSLPLSGANAIDYISQGNDSAYVMTWEPKGSMLAQSGELGYTYGIYSISPNGQDTTLYGTYLSIWKRQPNGSWKFVLDTGNEGVTIP